MQFAWAHRRSLLASWSIDNRKTQFFFQNWLKLFNLPSRNKLRPLQVLGLWRMSVHWKLVKIGYWAMFRVKLWRWGQQMVTVFDTQKNKWSSSRQLYLITPLLMDCLVDRKTSQQRPWAMPCLALLSLLSVAFRGEGWVNSRVKKWFKARKYTCNIM